MSNNRDNLPDWERQFWANKERQQAQQPVRPQTGGREIDAGALMAQRVMTNQALGSNSGGSSAVMLREGMPYYKLIPNPEGFGTTTPLIRHMGPLSQVAGKEFVVMNELRAYLVDNSPVVDLSKISSSPDKFLTLIRVRAPFVGDILVAKEAVVFSTSGISRGVLKG
jgi:hypothetical protein